MADVPDPNEDIEQQTSHSITARPSRASLPPSRRPSHRSLNSAVSPTGTSAAWTTQPPSLLPYSPGGTATATSGPSPSLPGDADEDDIEWGPSHPCFPHPNPHVALASPLYAATRVVRIQRDWLAAGDTYPALANLYPEILADWLDEAEFRTLIQALNERLKNAFRPNTTRAVVDAVLGVATGFLWDDFGATGAKGAVKGLETFMDGWNAEREKQGNPVRLIPLRRTGFMNLDIQIPDPGIDFVEGEE
ncbi:hypothetical protein ANO11243_089010 [Dothideomycetidae sp. 11243]|nr:hypothetical protein ANO11243_089010 [fungal sp. No.11243]